METILFRFHGDAQLVYWGRVEAGLSSLCRPWMGQWVHVPGVGRKWARDDRIAVLVIYAIDIPGEVGLATLASVYVRQRGATILAPPIRSGADPGIGSGGGGGGGGAQVRV